MEKMDEILLVDDHPLFRQALQLVIARAKPQFLILEAQSLADARRVLTKNRRIRLVLLDLKMPDCGGFTGLLSLRAEFPQAPIIVVSSSDDADTVGVAVRFGAVGFIPKSSSNTEISKALDAVLSGDIWIPRQTAPPAVSSAVAAIATLTPSQLKILIGLKKGLQNKQIAADIGVTERTIKAHITGLFRKLNVTNRTQAAIAAEALMLDRPSR